MEIPETLDRAQHAEYSSLQWHPCGLWKCAPIPFARSSRVLRVWSCVRQEHRQRRALSLAGLARILRAMAWCLMFLLLSPVPRNRMNSSHALAPVPKSYPRLSRRERLGTGKDR